MNRWMSRYIFYYPVTFLKGEFVPFFLRRYQEFQYRSCDDIEAYQRKRLLELLLHAQRHSSFYKRKLEDGIEVLQKGGGLKEALSTIPVVTKQDLIGCASQMATYSKVWSSSKTTGGSTGEPVKLYKNPEALARERAATWRSYEWAGVSIGDKQARFWGVPHLQSSRFKAQVVDFIANRFRISAFNLSDEALKGYYQEILSYRPDYLYGYVSVIEKLADFIESHGRRPIPSLKSIITTSEVLTESVRDRLSNVFQVRVFNEYGCGEVGSIAHECEHGSMHVMADNLYLEVDGEKTGEIIVTDFYNYAMPLIRYRLGDYATLGEGRCACGRSLPVIQGVHGRAYDLITTRSGRVIHPEAVMYVFEGIQDRYKAFQRFQVVQDSPEHFTIYIVPTTQWDESKKILIDQELKKNIFEGLLTDYKLVKEISREKSGKMRVIKRAF